MSTANTVNTDGPPLILNGDHAEFEREWAGKDPKDRPDWPYPSFDAKDWAQAYSRFNPDIVAAVGQEELDGRMIGWFSNSLMRGYDEGVAQMRKSFRNRSRWQRLLDLFR